MRLFLSAILVSSIAFATSLPQVTFDRVRSSIVRVDASDCAGDSRSGTGFVWQTKDSVVTALHVVGGCKNVSVYFEAQKKTRSTSIQKIFKTADLALLHVSNHLDDTEPLETAPNAPSANQELTVLGFPLLIPHMNSTTLKVRFGGNRLKEAIPPSVRAELAKVGSPSVDVEITNIEGHLLPGLSGAPILDDAGKVVAIADGGLENGTVSASWGMPYRYLTELSKSNETSTTAPANAHLFAADNSIQPGGDVTCGGATFSKIRTLDLSQIQHSTDDPAGFAQLIKASPVDTSGFSYDVYQDQQSGASFVTLAGKKVQEKNGRCVSYIDKAIHIEAELLPVMANSADRQRVSVQYENVSTPPPV